ncbi:hypothetical protein F5Y13DRAFT_153384 [Hypoxylon sp. FL1857]|nr:hypothetical protein F5Y13DRAFT_153384 [Hypoxylon sp. FL1857]
MARGRRYTDASDTYWIDLPAYGIVDIHNLSTSFSNHVHSRYLPWAKQWGQPYKDIVSLIQSCDKGLVYDALTKVAIYEFGWKTCSAVIDWQNTLDIAPLPQDARYTPGGVPVPRLIVAQWGTRPDGNMDCLEGRQVSYINFRTMVEGTLWIVKDRHRHGVQNLMRYLSL